MGNLLLVNRQNRLDKAYIPKDLEYIDTVVDVADEKKFMRKECCYYLRKMFNSAIKEGIELVGISGFRSYNRQKQIYENSIIRKGFEYTNKYIAYPGCSEHQSGLAIDISCKSMNFELEEIFAKTKEGVWLKNHVQNFGFIIRYPMGYEHVTGYEYEPWHIRYIGVEHALNMQRLDICTFEEYLDVIKNNSKH